MRLDNSSHTIQNNFQDIYFLFFCVVLILTIIISKIVRLYIVCVNTLPLFCAAIFWRSTNCLKSSFVWLIRSLQAVQAQRNSFSFLNKEIYIFKRSLYIRIWITYRSTPGSCHQLCHVRFTVITLPSVVLNFANLRGTVRRWQEFTDNNDFSIMISKKLILLLTQI